MTTFRHERARQIADRLWLQGRRYEAPQFENDYQQQNIDETHVLDDAVLAKHVEVCRRENAPESLAPVNIDFDVAILAPLAEFLKRRRPLFWTSAVLSLLIFITK